MVDFPASHVSELRGSTPHSPPTVLRNNRPKIPSPKIAWPRRKVETEDVIQSAWMNGSSVFADRWIRRF